LHGEKKKIVGDIQTQVSNVSNKRRKKII